MTRVYTLPVIGLGVIIGLAVVTLAMTFVGNTTDAGVTRIATTSTVAPSTIVIPPTSAAKPTTTTTAAPVAKAKQRPTLNAAGNVDGFACGASLPPCWVLRHEGPGGRPSPTAVNPTGCGGRTCGGLWQFDPVTWTGCSAVAAWEAGECPAYAGYARAELAPVDVQNDRARQVFAGGAGCSNWDAC